MLRLIIPLTIALILSVLVFGTLDVIAVPLRAVNKVYAAFFVSPDGKDTNPGSEMLPFKTIEGAQNVIRSLSASMTGDIIIYLRGGTHYLCNTIVFTKADSGTNGYNIIFRAYPGKTSHISGGQVLTGWTYVRNQIFKAPVGSLQFRQLYVNNRRAIRARYPNYGEHFKLVRWVLWDKSIKSQCYRYSTD